MLNLRLSEIAQILGAELLGAELPGADRAASGVAIDSRKVGEGDLFFALRGERVDGHDYLAAALERRAVAAVVECRVDSPLPQLVVAHSERALGDLARHVRATSAARVVGITGSNGKTTVKTLTASILARHGRTHVNIGNLNNEIGLPLSVLGTPIDAEFAVFEMGAGKPGDIAYLAAIARPQIGLVNNIEPAHLERMGSLEGIAQTKGAIYASLPDDGAAIINADDGFADVFIDMAGARRIITFGLDRTADVSARIDDHGRFNLHTPIGSIDVELALPGRHNIRNALAATAIALALDVPLATIRDGLQAATAVQGRLLRHPLASGAILIDDSYNANPGSFAAAIAALAAESGRRILVMGDMAELGPDAEKLHAATGALAARNGIDQLLAVGPLSRAAVAAFGANATHYADQPALITALGATLHSGTTLLVKGSRSAAMELVVAGLLDASEFEHGERHAA
ncbi:MAG: UDP-N-acetylmuramoyl-tripeptide--D-alanyl-D-alanine ligase [Dokdonella sp.]